MAKTAEIVVRCDACDTENHVLAMDVLGDEQVRCSRCGYLLGRVSQLAARSDQQQEPRNDANRT